MSKTSLTHKKIGIIGGGQLARMLVTAGHNLGFEMHVMSKSSGDPAALVSSHHFAGDPANLVHLTEFFQRVDIVTIESEFLDAHLLREAEGKTGKPVLPPTRLIDDLSDRLKQKTWLEKFTLPTSP